MVVVTSPIGDHAPPALAATTVRHKERNAADDPQQAFFVPRAHVFRHDFEAVVRVDEFDDRHGPEQEKQDLRYLAHVLAQMVRYLFRMILRENENRPADDARDQRNGSLVDFQPVFEGDGDIAENECK